ncbi:hypothetical protein, partial [Candidatus Halobonum tyrrellensis]
MPSRSEAPADPRFVDRWDGGFGWVAHPDETLRRASHALATDDGVWLVDPLDAPGVDDRVAELGEVAGVAVCSSWHARDAGAFADRYGVPVSVPDHVGRVDARVDAPVERVSGRLPGTEYRLVGWTPLPTWHEAMLYRASDGTLYVPEALGTAPTFRARGERLGVSAYARPFPPRGPLARVSPDRVLVGHGVGVFDRA